MLHELAVIGEAASRISPELKDRHPDIPWSEIVAFRNVVIHEYFGLSWPIIWVTATGVGEAKASAPELLLQDSILFAEVLDDRILLPGDPAGQAGDEDLPWLKDGGHSQRVATS